LSKPRVIKDYDKVDDAIISQIKLNYPHGFEKHLVSFKNAKGKFISALPFETEDRYYLIRMTIAEAQEIVQEDDDYDEDGHLKSDAIEELQEEIEMDEIPDADGDDD
jgi:hypothetical protein